MAHEIEHVEPLSENAGVHQLAALPGLGLGNLLGNLGDNLPLVLKVLAALNTGTGSFSTNTPIGRRWVVILDHPPKGPL